LQDELEMLLLYIDLEKLRFREGFEFIYEVNEEINTSHVQIPPMIIQPYIENAIWHGLLHKDQDRRLALRVSIDEKQVTCEIEDNGIGREQAAKIRSKSATRYKSMGMGITQDRITLMNSMSALGIRIDLIDKTTGAGHPAGTLVKIHIPHPRYTD
jgi:LytS/YehU family sensor histidine kinase